MHDRMPYLTWMFWVLAGGLTTVGVKLLLIPRSRDEWGGRDEDIQGILGMLLPTREVRAAHAHEHRHA
jgi:hypothetical protein